jgi:hypothetical protein
MSREQVAGARGVKHAQEDADMWRISWRPGVRPRVDSGTRLGGGAAVHLGGTIVLGNLARAGSEKMVRLR